MTQYANQFGQSVEQGQLDLSFGNNVISAVVLTDALVAGDRVKLNDSTGALPIVRKCADGDEGFGFVVRNLKKATFADGERVEIAIDNSVMYLVSSAAIARGAKIETVASGSTVKTWAGSNEIAGIAIDKFAGSSSIGRVLIKTPRANT